MPTQKIMIVDDDPDFIQTLGYDLTKKGYEIIAAKDGIEGLSKAKTDKPDLILLDIKMPKMDGYSFLRHLKKDPELRAIPFIVLTSYEMMEDMFLGEGVTDFFVKSMDTKDLLEVIQKKLKKPSGA